MERGFVLGDAPWLSLRPSKQAFSRSLPGCLPQSNRCWFADTIVKVKLKYNLTVDVIEAGALESVLRTCSLVEMRFSRRFTTR